MGTYNANQILFPLLFLLQHKLFNEFLEINPIDSKFTGKFKWNVLQFDQMSGSSSEGYKAKLIYFLATAVFGHCQLYEEIQFQSQIDKPKQFKYGYWRTDKKIEPGYSAELISCDTKEILDQTDLDTLEAWPYKGVDTLLKAFLRNAKRIPDSPMLGTYVDGEYKW